MREGAANSTRTARKPDSDGVAPSAHTHSEGDRRALPQSGSLRSGLDSSPPKPRRSPSRRLRTENSGHAAATATLTTATRNSDRTATDEQNQNKGRTAWELRELIRPLPIRRRPTAKRPRPHEFDPALIEWVYGSRFAIVSQLQRRFPERLPSLRTAQRHVRRLVQMGLLAQTPVRSTGPHFPTVVYTTGKGINLLRETYRRLGHEWDEPRTEDGKAHGLALDAILHELLITEFDLSVQRTVEARDDLVLLERERRYFRRDRSLAYEWQGREHRIIPDAGYLTAIRSSTRGKLLPLMILEMENGTHTMRKLRRKFQAYRRWSDSGADDWLRRVYRPFNEPQKRSYRLLLVAHDKHGTVSDERRLLDLLIQALELPRTLRNNVWLTTAEALIPHRHTPAPLDAAVWFRAKDCGSFLTEFRDLPTGRGQAQYTGQRRFLEKRLAEMPRHRLFPQP